MKIRHLAATMAILATILLITNAYSNILFAQLIINAFH